MPSEVHVYEDSRGDTGQGTHPWGVYRRRYCVECGQLITLVKRVEVTLANLAYGDLCSRHNPALASVEPVWEEGVQVWRVPAKLDC